MKKLLVTGSAGLVGSACVELFTAKGWDVVGIDNNVRAALFGTERRSGFTVVDICVESMVEDLFKEHKFDAIIHAAGQPSHDWATDHVLEDFKINTLGTLHLLEATREYCPEATFVHVSTDKVYGENMSYPLYLGKNEAAVLVEKDTRFEGAIPFNEELGLDFAGKRSLFGCSKTAADIYAQEYANYFGMKVGIFRPGCITGKKHQGAEFHGFLAYLTRCIKEGTTYKIFGHKGKQVRDQIHASDLAAAFYEFVLAPKSDVFNMGGGPERSVSVLEAGKMISEKLGKPFLYEFAEARRGDRVFDIHDVSKFRAAYPNWTYKFDLQAIIADLCG